VDDQIGGPTPAHSVAKACVQIAHSLLINPEKRVFITFLVNQMLAGMNLRKRFLNALVAMFK
jgi:hypothetical protein